MNNPHEANCCTERYTKVAQGLVKLALAIGIVGQIGYPSVDESR